MRVLWDVDIEIDCAVPSAPLVDVEGKRVIVAGGEHALLARIHRETGTVENALFTDDTDVEVSAPVVVPRAQAEGDGPVQYAFASIDRPRLHLNITVVDEHMRVVRSRDISADDPDTPELLVDGRISHFSAHLDEERREPFFVVSVREPSLPERADAPLYIVRCVWDDLASRWSSRRDDVYAARDGILVMRSVDEIRCVRATDGDIALWSQITAGYSFSQPHDVAGVGPGVVAFAVRQDVEVYETLPPRIDVRDIASGRELHALDLPLNVEVRDVVPRGSMFTSVWRRGRNTYALLHAGADTQDERAMIDVAHAPLLIDDAHALVGDALVQWRVNEALTRLPLALTARARATIADDVAYIRDGKRLLAVTLEQ